MSIERNYLSVMNRTAKDNASMMIDALEDALANVMNSLNIGMISFVPNGNNSNYDVPRAFVVVEDDKYVTGNDYSVKEIIAVLVKHGRIFIVPDTPNISNELLNELENWTHFVCCDVADLKVWEYLTGSGLIIAINNNFNLINMHDTMLSLFKSCVEALETIKEPLDKSINISEPK